MTRKVAVALAAVLLLAAACSGGSDSDSDSGADDRETESGPTPLQTKEPPDWQDGELTEEELDGRCDEEPSEALDLLGIEYDMSLHDCYWEEEDGDRTVRRSLDLGLQAYEPDAISGTATETAQAAFESGEAADTAPMIGEYWSGGRWADAQEVSWLGDEAKARVRTDPGDAGTQSIAQVMVRHRNVILTAHAEVNAHTAEGEAQVPPLEDLEAAVVSAAMSVLNAIGAESDQPAAPDRPAGEHPEALPVCGPLADHADALVPGHERTDLSPDAPARSGCSWDVETDTREIHLEVKVEALAPSRLLGLGGSELAAEQLRDLTGDDWREVNALGDAATIDRGRPDDSEYGVSELWVRQDNLLIHVYHGMSDPPSGEELDRRTIDVARDVLAAYE
jgi:hypothetical protein